MDALVAARVQMGFSLCFHLVFAALGIGLPLLMAASEWLALRTGAAHFRELAKIWSKAAALAFVIGAVSGTALSFELGLGWPRFMGAVGATIGPAFALEGFAFFIEAIFLALYVYGWERLTPRAHWLVGLVVAISGMLSGVLVIAANAWMQHPVDAVRGAAGIWSADPASLFANPTWPAMALHSTLACYSATGAAVAGVYALRWLRGDHGPRTRSALAIAMLVGGVATALQPLAGDLCAQRVVADQPAKFAAMEAHFATRAGAALTIGGWPDAASGTVRGGIEVPRLLSLLAHHDADAEVIGLDRFPRDDWPDVAVCHLAFDLMVAGAAALLAVAAWYGIARARDRLDPGRGLHLAILIVAPAGFIALEAGWIVTEVGRQPWIVQGLMRTRDAATTDPAAGPACIAFIALYLLLGGVLVGSLLRLGRGQIGSGHGA